MSNGASTSGMVLAIYRYSSPINSPFASPKHIWPVSHPFRVLTSTFASYTPPQSQSQYLSLSHKSFPIKTLKNSSYISKGEWSYLLKKRERKEKKEREAHSPSSKSCKSWSSNISKWEVIYFIPSYLPDIPSLI